MQLLYEQPVDIGVSDISLIRVDFSVQRYELIVPIDTVQVVDDKVRNEAFCRRELGTVLILPVDACHPQHGSIAIYVTLDILHCGYYHIVDLSFQAFSKTGYTVHDWQASYRGLIVIPPSVVLNHFQLYAHVA